MVSHKLTLYFLLLMSLLSLVLALPMLNSPNNYLQLKGNRNTLFSWALLIGLIFWFGNRQLFGGGYVDTANYAREYIAMSPGIRPPDFNGEWIWALLMQSCKTLGVKTQTFFTIVEAGYILPIGLAMKKFLPSNPFLGVVIVLSSLFFLPFGVNGIRNGLACNLLLLGIAYLFQGKYLQGFLISAICFGIHRSTILPLAATVTTLFFFRDVKLCVYFWLVSIVLSLTTGTFFTNFFAGLGFDDRMSQYTAEQDMSMFSKTGFRWDFLIYSAPPVIFSWYVYVTRRISDNWFNAIASIYLICNSFWILVIRSSYSNRFAYLSWFIYPLVIAYPLVILPVWHDQDNKTGLILIAYIGFTFVMNFLWHSF